MAQEQSQRQSRTRKHNQQRVLYKPLPDPTRFIRVLKLFAAYEGDVIRGQTFELELLPPRLGKDQKTTGFIRSYTALSYAWGSPHELTCSIILNGHECVIRRRLWDFLRRLRRTETHGCVWADAICVNQYDLLERNSQVYIMGEIFQHATSVVVWLRTSAGSSDKLFDLFNLPSLMFEATWSQWQNPIYYPGGERMIYEVFVAFIELSKREYWQRMWIIQEIGLAVGAVIYFCGDRQAEHCRLRFAHDFIKAKQVYFDQKFLDGRMSAVLRLRLTNPNGVVVNQNQLMTLLSVYGASLCANPQDKVYALLSMAYDVQRAWRGGSEALKPDYGIDITQLFWDVCNFCNASTIEFLQLLF